MLTAQMWKSYISLLPSFRWPELSYICVYRTLRESGKCSLAVFSGREERFGGTAIIVWPPVIVCDYFPMLNECSFSLLLLPSPTQLLVFWQKNWSRYKKMIEIAYTDSVYYFWGPLLRCSPMGIIVWEIKSFAWLSQQVAELGFEPHCLTLELLLLEASLFLLLLLLLFLLQCFSYCSHWTNFPFCLFKKGAENFLKS